MEDLFWKNVEREMSREEFLSQFVTTKNYQEQLNLTRPFLPEWNLTLDEPFMRESKAFQKNDKLSSEHCDNMEKCVQQGLFKEAIQQSNLALAYADSLGSLAAAYASKSVLHHHFHNWGPGLQEIDTALSLTATETEVIEPEERSAWEDLRVTYQKELEREREGGQDDPGNHHWTMEKDHRKKFCQDLFTLKSPNEGAPAIENFVEIKFNSERGRHLVIQRDLPVGQTLLVEMPFVSGLNGTLDLEQAHCHHCLQRSLHYVPCASCIFALFCSKKCAQEASTTYHKFECPCLPDLGSLLTKCKRNHPGFDGVNIYLAFKLICKLGPQFLFQLFKSPAATTTPPKERATASDLLIPGADPITKIYDSSSYLPIDHLACQFNTQKGHLPTLISAILVKILSCNTPFFDNIEPSSSGGGQLTQFKEFVTLKIISHYASIRVNVFSLWELNGKVQGEGGRRPKRQSKLDYEVNLFARGIYPTASLLNHSCDPNVMLFPNVSMGQIAIVSIKPLKENEELTIFYCPPFPDQRRMERQNRLWTGYSFHCTCVACVEKWPTMTEGLGTILKKFCCPKCTPQHFHEMRRQDKMEALTLNEENGFRCPTCKIEYSERDILNQFSNHKRALNVSLRHLQKNAPIDALQTLARAIHFFDENVSPPNAFAMFIQKFYIEAIQYVVNFS